MSDSYRERIAAFYRHYCPEKPASHVDFLLAKYAGHEEAVLEILRDKYGPEPEPATKSYQRRVETLLRADGESGRAGDAARSLLGPFDQQESVLLRSLATRIGTEPHTRFPPDDDDPAAGFDGLLPAGAGSGVGGSAADLEAALRARHAQFRKDMHAVAAGQARSQQLATLRAVAEARLEVQRQDVEIRQLRLSASAQVAQATANERAFGEAIQTAAKQLTAAKLRQLKLESTRNASVVSAADFEDVIEKTTAIEREFERSVSYCRMLADVVQRHLRLHPMSPMHATLRQLDPALAARLEQLPVARGPA